MLQSLSDFYPPPERARIQRYEKPPASRLLEAARRLPDWQVYLDFARFPLETVYPEGGGEPTIILQDLRFLPFFTRALGARPGPGHPPAALRLPGRGLTPVLNAVELGFVRGGR